ncbi:hypothetical protein BB560_003005 [Smittium megazygosporum]|uniref:Ribosomal protein S2 n=1 Tax=Smittium megazygosporum TaxID=133381 RepID=A0A2T9ZD62_9FUNG|nr:hypothetical protein BB560_003005 [Smittium megazygosporum]
MRGLATVLKRAQLANRISIRMMSTIAGDETGIQGSQKQLKETKPAEEPAIKDWISFQETLKRKNNSQQSQEERKSNSIGFRALMPELERIGNVVQSEAVDSQRCISSVQFLKPNDITIPLLMAANVHLGHSKETWHKLNIGTVFGERNDIMIINLEQTLAALRRCANFVRETAYNGGIIVFVGTNQISKQAAIDAALLSDQYYVVDRWYAGTLTNSNIVLKKQTKYINQIYDTPNGEELFNLLEKYKNYNKDGSSDSRSQFGRRSGRFQSKVREIPARFAKPEHFIPDLVIALNPLDLESMLAEALRAVIPTVGIVDTNYNPELVTYAIPGNDDSASSVNLIASYLASAAKIGKENRIRDSDALMSNLRESIDQRERSSEQFESD